MKYNLLDYFARQEWKYDRLLLVQTGFFKKKFREMLLDV